MPVDVRRSPYVAVSQPFGHPFEVYPLADCGESGSTDQFELYMVPKKYFNESSEKGTVETLTYHVESYAVEAKEGLPVGSLYDTMFWLDTFEQELRNYIIPLVESTYSTCLDHCGPCKLIVVSAPLVLLLKKPCLSHDYMIYYTIIKISCSQ